MKLPKRQAQFTDAWPGLNVVEHPPERHHAAVDNKRLVDVFDDPLRWEVNISKPSSDVELPSDCVPHARGTTYSYHDVLADEPEDSILPYPDQLRVAV
jgi:hypothetical protein